MPVAPYNEERIGDDDIIIRRINPDQHIIWDENRNKLRISSKAYNKSSGLRDGMSVDIEALIAAAGVNPKAYVTTPVFTGSVAFLAGKVRALGFWVGYEPIKENPFHGKVWAKTEKRNFSDSEKRRLAGLATWYVTLPGVDIV